MGKIIKWFTESHHWLHILIGLLVGFGSNSVYCAAYVGIGISITSELKDKLWGGLWDWVDFTITLVSVAIGYTIRGLIFGFSLV